MKKLVMLGLFTLGVLQINAISQSGPMCQCPANKRESRASVQKRNQRVRDCLKKYGYGQLRKCCAQGRCEYTNY